ncbi:MAG: hypothetical protein NZ951_01745 [Dehalococcoidia bacterium]|nr:hypothetical protein [Dehalococcoidia bacterium]MDW8119553.1 hypothetical protein [Chloroflexota bacterium]
MSKLFQKIEQASKGTPAPLGFATRREERIPPILLILAASHPEDMSAARAVHPDAFLFPSPTPQGLEALAEATQGIPWGVEVVPWSASLAEKALQHGADFLVVDMGAPLEALNHEDLGRVVHLPKDVPEEVANALEPLPVDGVILAEPVKPPLSLATAVELAVWRGKIPRPVLVPVEHPPSAWELETLRDIGISGVVVSCAQMKPAALQDLRQRLQSLAHRRPSKDRPHPLLPQVTVPTAARSEEEEEEDEE